MKPYYYVYRSGYGKQASKHLTLESAYRESERLAAKNPGSTYEILQCVGITRPFNTKTHWAEGVMPPHRCLLHRDIHNNCAICGESLEIRQLMKATTHFPTAYSISSEIFSDLDETANFQKSFI